MSSFRWAEVSARFGADLQSRTSVRIEVLESSRLSGTVQRGLF